ncbi:MAG: DUF4267 domain-containing protein [Nocardioidaceae bacterium]|nr:DUF4267 domain-containing protein [Nocardioidaceae bacterium]
MDPVTGLSLGRIAIGAVAFAAPETGTKLFGFDPQANPQLGMFGRLFGAREIALGAITLVSSGSLRRNLTWVGMAVDGADAASAVVETSQGNIPKMAGGPMMGVALGAVAAGAAALAINRGKR